jgi:outer membrane usher protein
MVSAAFAHPAFAAVDPAELPPYAETRINNSGHALRITASLNDGSGAIGDVPVEIGTDDSVSVERTALLDALRPHLAPEILTRIATISPGDVMVPLSSLADVGGVKIMFSPADMGLVLKKSAATSATTDIPMRGNSVSAVNHEPAAVSGFVNVTTSVDAVWDTPAGPPVNMNLEFNGAVRALGFVLEGEGRLDGPLDSLICPAEAECSYEHRSGFKREATRLVRELDGPADVITLGDISYSGYSVQRGNDLLGVGVSHDVRRFGGDDRLNATGSLLTLDSPGEVEVLVNGAPLEHLHLNTGTYRLTDLPLLTGANTVQLLVTTADGQSRKIVLTALSDDGMLRPGSSEWNFNVGVASFLRDAGRAYLADRHVANGYWRYGLSPLFTADVHAQADTDVAMAGADLFSLTPFGLFSVGAAASMPVDGAEGMSGFAVTLGWQFVRPAADGRKTASLTARYAGKGFTTPGNEIVGETGILYPTLDPTLLVSGSWSYELPNQWVLSGSGRYAIANTDSTVPGALDTGDRWGGDAAVTVPISRSLQATLWMSYGNEHLLTFFTSPDTEPDFTVGTRIAWQPDDHTDVYANTDSGLHASSLYGSIHTGTPHDGWDGTVSAVDTESIDSTLTASLGHRGRFEETNLVQTTAFERDPFTSKESYQRTSLRSSTAIAFADGHVGIGPPIRDGFAVVYPHSSISGSEITVGETDHPDAKGNALLAAVVPDLPSHQVTTLPIDASNLPLGYSLGDAMLKVKPPYKAGYAVEVGSDHAMSVFGSLVDERGEPLSLTTGTATCGGRAVELFTNAKGRFGLEGISAGTCLIRADGPRGPLTFELTLSSGSSALVKAGTLHPNEKGEPAHAPWITVTLPADPYLRAASR